MKYRRKDFSKLYNIYLTCKTHAWKPYQIEKFRELLKKYDSIIDICEKERWIPSRKKEPLSEKEIKKIEEFLKMWIKTYQLPECTWISIHRIYKYYINPKKAKWEIS